MDPAVAALRGGLPEDTRLAEGVDCLVALLRARGALRDGDLRLPPRAGVPAVARRLRAALARIEAPDPGFAAPPPYRLVRNTGELQRIGEAFGNCVALPQWGAAQHHLGLIDGTAVFLACDDPPLLVLLRRVADRTWHLEQCFGPKNASPPPGARSALRRDLGAAGLRIVAADPQSALGRLEQEARRGRGGEVDPGEVDADLDDAAVTGMARNVAVFDRRHWRERARASGVHRRLGHSNGAPLTPRHRTSTLYSRRATPWGYDAVPKRCDGMRTEDDRRVSGMPSLRGGHGEGSVRVPVVR
jgi:hypothetical protein